MRKKRCFAAQLFAADFVPYVIPVFVLCDSLWAKFFLIAVSGKLMKKDKLKIVKSKNVENNQE